MIKKKEVFSYTAKTNKNIYEYNFWKNEIGGWSIIFTHHNVDAPSKSTEIFIPKDVVDIIISEAAKDGLRE